MRLITKLAIGAGAFAFIKGIDNRMEITTFEQKLCGLPEAFDRFRIALISDLHSEVIDGLDREIEKLEPDMIAVTGDLIHDDNRDFSAVTRLLKKLSDIAPCYIVSGNHDLWNTRFPGFVKDISEYGVKCLDDSMCTISRGEDELALFGIRDPFGKSSEIIDKNLKKSFSLLPEYDGFKILLFHRANLYPRFLGKGFDLILSGHMHGGQFRFRGLGGLLPPKSALIDSSRIIFPKYTEGVYTDGKTTMIVSRGIGNPMVIPRLYNRPETVNIILRVDRDRQ